MADRIADLEAHRRRLEEGKRLKQEAEAAGRLSGDGEGPTFSGMDTHGLDTRLSRLEGGNSLLQWSVGIVSASLLAAAAIVVGLQLYTLSQVGSLEQQVQALPGEINRNLLELNRTLATAITAAKEPTTVAPVIVLPGADGAYQVTHPKQPPPAPEKAPAQ